MGLIWDGRVIPRDLLWLMGEGIEVTGMGEVATRMWRECSWRWGMRNYYTGDGSERRRKVQDKEWSPRSAARKRLFHNEHFESLDVGNEKNDYCYPLSIAC